MRFASRIDEVPPHLFVEISRKVAEKKVQGIDVISFGIGDPDIPTPSNVAGSVHVVFQGEWPDKVANQTPKTLPDSHRSSTGGGYSSRYDKVANQTQKHCWTAVGAAPGADTPLGTTQDGRRDS